jgi:hypothetical protein
MLHLEHKFVTTTSQAKKSGSNMTQLNRAQPKHFTFSHPPKYSMALYRKMKIVREDIIISTGFCFFLTYFLPILET